MIEGGNDDKNDFYPRGYIISRHSNLTELIKLKINSITRFTYRVFSLEVIFYSATTMLFLNVTEFGVNSRFTCYKRCSSTVFRKIIFYIK